MENKAWLTVCKTVIHRFESGCRLHILNSYRLQARICPSGGMADTPHSKCGAARRASSSLASGIRKKQYLRKVDTAFLYGFDNTT